MDGSGRCQYCGTQIDIMVMDEALDSTPAYIEITENYIRIGVPPLAGKEGEVGNDN